ncbi:MAG: hypothetical protein GC202_08070 [Alphaproteobacteria bacterium]|nr:hypothetical protein [Alphaproteobacteria bacterium]
MHTLFARLFLPFAIALVVAGPAVAQTKNSPARAEAEGEFACGGEARDLPCAVALFFACAARQTEDACTRVGLTEIPKLADKPQPIEYAIDRTSTIRPEDVTDELRHLAWFRPGFLLVEAEARRCQPGVSCANEDWSDWQVYLRFEDGRYFVVYWRGDSEPETPPDIPDDFMPTPAPPPAEPEVPR